MTNFQQAFDRVQSLVDAFSRNRVTLRAPSYQEAEVRKDFIDPFFSALGWDVGHEFQKNPYEQEVRVERRVLGADSRISRRADYAFYVRPNFKDARFFVEAKKPARDLNNADDYFQTARYGWSAQAPISVLTDFEEFHVIDCRQQPQINSALGLGLDRFSFEDYAKEETFRRIYHVFSREAMEEDAIARYLSQKPEPRGRVVQWGLFSGGYQPIDDSFLGYLDELRRRLARAFKSRNPELDSRELTEVTQRTIDRLIFIRFLEDRLIEPEPIVRELAARGPGGWAEFVRTCRRLNAKYNGIVFRHHFSDEPRFEGADPDIFQRICAELSDSTSPYNFDAFPVHILGSIYERFLGHVVEATPTIARVVEKPEVRKAGGVYYTPSYISHHIVGDTVGRLIDGKSPKQIAKMRFADIACGSGSFLIDVFDTLLTYHGGWYQEHPEQAKRQGCHYDAEEGLWRLSLAQKRGILENCVYGVDVDDQAVEVAQMSLYIKLLESETTASANELQVLFKEKILPDLTSASHKGVCPVRISRRR